MESTVDIQHRLKDGLNDRQRFQLSKLIEAVRAAALAAAKFDELIEKRDAMIIASVDRFDLDMRRVVVPATGLTHTRINQILAEKG